MSDRAAQGAKTEGAKTEGANTMGAKTEGAKTEGAKTEGAKTVGAKTEGPKTEGAKTVGPKTEGPKTEGAKADTGAAAAAAAAAPPQDVALYVIAHTPAALDEFKANFAPADGYRVALTYGAPPAGQSGGFDAASYTAALRARRMGHLLLFAPTIGSTQEFMRRHGAVLPEGTVLAAGRQTSGKGRGGNQWTSPDGCLMFTAGRRLSIPGARAPFVNYVVCLAVARGLADAAAPHLGPGAPPPDVRIKWPNDLYAGADAAVAAAAAAAAAAGAGGASADAATAAAVGQRVKIGGALIHTTWSGGAFNVLAGVGVNVANREPTTCLEEVVARQIASAATAAAASAGGGSGSGGAAVAPAVKVDRAATLAAVVNRLEEAYDVFESAGFKPLEPDYLQRWLHSGQQVDVDAEAAASAANTAGGGGSASAAAAPPPPRETARMTIVGLSEGGFLLAADAAGARYELSPDGNSFDFFSGLIRRKL